MRGLSGHFSFFLCVCLTVIGSSSRLPINLLVVVCLEADVSPSSGIRVPVCVCFGSDADVSPVIGVRAPRLPSGVRFGSDADVSPVIGIQAPRLPLPVFVCARVSRATNALILLRPRRYVCIGCDILPSQFQSVSFVSFSQCV